MKNPGIILVLLTLFLTGAVLSEEHATPPDTVKAITDTLSVQTDDQIIVYYMHMNRRCMTCEKLETYAVEAILTGFNDQLKDSSMVWRLVNMETEGNEQYSKEYKLFSQSVIVSRVRDGKEVSWKNLDKIWELVRDKEAYIDYVQNEIKMFMAEDIK